MQPPPVMVVHDDMDRKFRGWAGVLCFLLLCVASSTTVFGEFVPNIKPSLEIPPLEGKIVIDGVDDEDGWVSAAVAENFSETKPGDMTKPPVDTKVYITYSETHLYLLFKAYDDPTEVRSSLTDRDNIFRDDYIGIILDTYGDLAWAYELFVNPRGIQGDLRWNNGGNEDAGFDIVWESEGKITEDGWQVEVAIPFSSLRFPNREEQTWVATFWRDRARESRCKYSWAAIDRDEPCWPCNFGTLTGIKNVKPGGTWELLPSVIATQSGEVKDHDNPSAGFDNNDPEAEVSLNARYSLASDLMAEVAVNPDFSQVESDASQIDVNTTTALFYPERRPFFQEGSELFNTWVDVVYTRSINNPRVAGKLYGRLNRTSLAFVAAQDENSVSLVPQEDRTNLVQNGKAFSNIFRIKQTVMDDSFIGATATDRRFEGSGSGSSFSVDSRLRFLRNYGLEVQGVLSRVEEPEESFMEPDDPDTALTFDGGRHTVDFDGESYWGHAVYASLERDARVWNANLNYWEYSPTYRAENGFVTNNASRTVDFWTGLFFRRDEGLVEAIEPSIQIGRKWNFKDQFKDEWLRPEFYIQLKSQTELGFEYLISQERFKDTVLSGIRLFEFWVDSRFSRPVEVGTMLKVGHQIARRITYPVMASSFQYELWGRIRPSSQITITPSIEFFDINFPDDLDMATYPGTSGSDPDTRGVISPGGDISATWLVRTQVNYQFTRRLFLRLIIEYVDEENTYRPDRSYRDLLFEPLLTYEVNPFTKFYIGSAHDYTDFEYDGFGKIRRRSQQFFAKIQYLFSG